MRKAKVCSFDEMKSGIFKNIFLQSHIFAFGALYFSLSQDRNVENNSFFVIFRYHFNVHHHRGIRKEEDNENRILLFLHFCIPAFYLLNEVRFSFN